MGVTKHWAALRLPRQGSPAEADDAALVGRARAGDADAFARLIEAEQDRVYALTLRMVGPDAAEDLAQRAVVKAWRNLDRFDGRAAFGTWLYRIAVNQCLDHLRHAARHRTAPLADLPGDDEDVGAAVVLAAEGEARRAALAWATPQLAAEDRLLLHLRVAEERSYGEIAGLLGLNPRTVGTRLFRIRARLHALITRRLEEHDDLR